MTNKLSQAFKDHGMRAHYNGLPAIVLPLSATVYKGLNDADAFSAVGQPVEVGQLMVSWKDNGVARGAVLSVNASNDIKFIFAKNDGTEASISAYGDLADMGLKLIAAARDAERNAKEVAEYNADLQAKYDADRSAGKEVEEPVLRTPTYKSDAFAKVENYSNAVLAHLKRLAQDPLTDPETRLSVNVKTEAYGRQLANTLTYDELQKARELRSIRQEIGRLNPDHPDALRSPAEVYQADDAGQAASDLVRTINMPGEGFTARQMAMMAANPTLTQEVFSVLTTTPVSALISRRLSGADYATAAQELARDIETEWSPTAIGHIQEVLNGRMPGYGFSADLYTRDGADILLVRDAAGAYLYSWDSASRVAEINVNEEVLYTLTKDDVPSNEKLEEMRRKLNDLKYVVEDTISFG